MSDQVIPNTENARVAAVAAALELVMTVHRAASEVPELDQLIADFQKAYKGVRVTTVQGQRSSSASAA